MDLRGGPAMSAIALTQGPTIMTGLFLIRAITHIHFQTGFGQIFGRNCRKPGFSCVSRFRKNGLRRRFDPRPVAQIAEGQKLTREWKRRWAAAQIQLF
jgi:hypothetical protein